jgi:hypothetical protein
MEWKDFTRGNLLILSQAKVLVYFIPEFRDELGREIEFSLFSFPRRVSRLIVLRGSVEMIRFSSSDDDTKDEEGREGCRSEITPI